MPTKKPVETTFYVATVIDSADRLHIAAGRDVFAGLCGAAGMQQFPKERKVTDLCPRCVERHMRALLNERMKGVGL